MNVRRWIARWCLTSVVIAAGAAEAQVVTAVSSAKTEVSQSHQASRAGAGAGLTSRLSVDLVSVPLQVALETLIRQSGVPIAYSKTIVPMNRRVSVRGTNITLAAALRQTLKGTGIEARVDREGGVMLVREQRSQGTTPQAQGILQGLVTTKETGQPVAGARVTVVGTPLTQLTDDKGAFIIRDIPAGTYQVRVTRLGHQPAEARVVIGDGATSTSNFVLTVIPTKLNEIVTTGAGDRRRVEVGNSIATIQADSIVPTAPIRSVTDLINGRVPGAQVIYSNGVTGSGSKIRIRGTTTLPAAEGGNLNKNEPVVILDGVRINADPGPVTGDRNLGGAKTNRLDDLDPETIESIDVLKGPSASTLYGTDAANGVIVIRTKRGKAGATRWSASGSTGFNEVPTRFPEFYRSWGVSATNSFGTLCTLPDAAVGACTIDSLTHWNPLNHKELSPLRRGEQWQAGTQVSGGYERLRYFLSGTTSGEGGVVQMPPSEVTRIRRLRNGDPLPNWQINPNRLDRTTIAGNLSAVLSDKADITFFTNFHRQDQRAPLSLDFVRASMDSPGYRDANDGWPEGPPGESFTTRTTEAINRATGSMTASWRPFSWLTGDANGGVDFTDQLNEVLARPGDTPAGAADLSRHFARYDRDFVNTLNLMGSALFRLPFRTTSRTALGAQYTSQRSNGIIGTGFKLPVGRDLLNEATGGKSVLASRNETITAGVFIEHTAAIFDRLYITGPSFRSDVGSSFGKLSSSFGKLNRSTFYPKTDVSWLVSKENFFPKTPAVTNLRLRLAYGHAGIQPTQLQALRTYRLETTFLNNVQVPIATLRGVGNAVLRPERVREWEGGFDLGLLQDRVTLDLTYYSKFTRDAIISKELPSSLMADFRQEVRQENVGSVKNAGAEWSLNANVLEHPLLSWSVSLGGSSNSNRLVSLNPEFIVENGQQARTRNVPGYSLFGRWSRPILGYRDANSDGIITPSEVQIGDSAIYIGSAMPKVQMALSNTVGLFNNRLSVAAQLDYRGGYVQENRWSAICTNARFVPTCRALNDPATPLALQAGAAAQTRGVLTDVYEPVSFTRFRELAVTYRADGRAARMLLGSRTASFTVNVRNLALFSHYRGPDPEVTTSENGYSDNGTIPLTRTYNFRINLGF